MSKFIFISDSSNIKGNKINIPPAGEGIPSKKFFFQDSFSFISVRLNLASLRTEHTEYMNVIAHPIFP